MDNFKNESIVDTSTLIHLGQFNYVYPEFFSGAKMALVSTGTNLIIPEQCEREYICFKTFSLVGTPQEISNIGGVFTSADSTGALSSPYFFPSANASSDGIIYQRGLKQNLPTTTQTDINSADSSVTQYSNYEYSNRRSVKIVTFSDNPNDIRKKLNWNVPLANSLDFIWGVSHHSKLLLSDIAVAVELLREDSQKFKAGKESFFRTDFWRSGARTPPGVCVFCAD